MVLPGVLRAAQKVVLGRAEPNTLPHLPRPFGRMILSVNPCDVIVGSMGQAMIMRVLCASLLAVCGYTMLYVVPSMFGAKLAGAV